MFIWATEEGRNPFLLFHSSNVHIITWFSSVKPVIQLVFFLREYWSHFVLFQTPVAMWRAHGQTVIQRQTWGLVFSPWRKETKTLVSRQKQSRRSARKVMFLYFFLFLSLFWMSLFECYFEHVCYNQTIHYMSTYIIVT